MALPQEPGFAHLVVDNNLHVKDILVHHSLDSLQVAPDVVGVENLAVSHCGEHSISNLP